MDYHVRKVAETKRGRFILRIPKEFAEALSIRPGDYVTVQLDENSVYEHGSSPHLIVKKIQI